MLKAREYHSSCVLRGQLYVVASDSTERYDHMLDCWEALPPMPHPMDNCSTTTCAGRLYAIGCLAGEDTMAVQRYDADTNRWAVVNCGELPPWSFTPKTVTLKSLIYFIRWVFIEAEGLRGPTSIPVPRVCSQGATTCQS